MCSPCRTGPGRAPSWALAGLALWALINGGLVAAGFSEWPLISLALGLAGACAIVTSGTLLARMHWLSFLRYCGEHSIVIYLAFFLPMAATRTLLLKTGLIHDIGTISLVVTIAGVAGALALWRIALKAGANFLFERPAAFWIAPKKPQASVAGGGVSLSGCHCRSKARSASSRWMTRQSATYRQKSREACADQVGA